jgi:hypothetical protein
MGEYAHNSLVYFHAPWYVAFPFTLLLHLYAPYY